MVLDRVGPDLRSLNGSISWIPSDMNSLLLKADDPTLPAFLAMHRQWVVEGRSAVVVDTSWCQRALEVEAISNGMALAALQYPPGAIWQNGRRIHFLGLPENVSRTLPDCQQKSGFIPSKGLALAVHPFVAGLCD